MGDKEANDTFFRMTNRVVLKTGTGKYEKTQFLGYQLKLKKNQQNPKTWTTEHRILQVPGIC